jgi:hypothetical protein
LDYYELNYLDFAIAIVLSTEIHLIRINLIILKITLLIFIMMNTNMYNHYTVNNNSEQAGDQLIQHATEHNSEIPWTRASKDPNLIIKGTELFVGNLSTDTTEEDLFEIFRDCGEVIDVTLS